MDHRGFYYPTPSGSVDGHLSIDNVCLAGVCANQIVFGETDHEEGPILYSSKFDGSLGLGCSYCDVYNVSTVFNSLLEQKKLDKGIFAFWLNKNSYRIYNGELVLGGIDERHYTGEINYVPVVNETRWEVKIDKINVKTTLLCSNCTAIISTGTALITGPTKIVDQLQKAIGAVKDSDGIYHISCDQIDKVPEITITIDGRNYSLTGRDYIVKTGFNTCFSGIFGLDLKGGSTWILGESFMGKYYSVFDVDNKKVGFAEAKHPRI